MTRPRLRALSLSFETLEERHLLTAGPFISEFMASNGSGLQDQDGDFSDWIEVSNFSPADVDLAGWYLTDDDSDLTQWQFPSVMIPAGESLVVFASSKNLTNPAFALHTSFNIGASGEYLALIEPDGTTIASQFSPEFPPQSSDVSYGYEPVSTSLLVSGATASVIMPTDNSLDTLWVDPLFDDSTWTSGNTGIGYHTNGDYDSLIGANVQAAMQGVGSSAYIRVPFTIADLSVIDGLLLQMQYDDGFVAYLNGTEVARQNAPTFAEWDSVASTPQPNGVPSVDQFNLSSSLSTLVQGDNVLAIHGLNESASDTDFLIAPELVALDLNAQPPTFLDVATPGAINLPFLVNQVAGAVFSHERGFYDAPFDLVLTSDTPDAQIRYTTDGSAPTTTTGSVYNNSAIPINTTAIVRAIAYKPGLQAAEVLTQSFIFLDDVLQQPANIPGYPNEFVSVGKGQSVFNDYEMDPDIVNDPAYSGVIKDGLLSIPTMSISADLADMYGSSGFYSGDSEKPVSIEIIDPAHPNENLQVNGGIESHSHNRLKRSLRLSFKSEYGPTKLVSNLFKNAPLNGDSASNTLDPIVLRAGNNRAWSRAWNPGETTFTEDQWYRDTQNAMSGVGSHGAFVHLYINGIYWGLYNPVERPDEKFSSEYFGGADENWFSTNHDGRTEGDSTRWDYLRGPLIAKDLSVAANYAELQQYLDVDNFSDYLLLNWYQATTDWPNNNWYVGNRTDVPTPTQFYAWDGEWSWDVSNGSSVDGAWVHPSFRSGASSNVDAAKIWRELTDSSDFMMNFADRAYQHLFNDGALTDASSLERWQTLNDHIRNAVVAESARWGDSLESIGQPTRTRDVDWQNEVNQLNSLTVGNATQLIMAMRAEGYFPSIDAPTYSQQGGNVAQGYNLQITTPAGANAVYFTTDGSDPRLSGGGISPAAELYDPGSGVSLQQSVSVKSRALNGSEWSALNEAQFEIVTGGSNAPPMVNAGTNQTITLPNSAMLQGLANDDGLPSGSLTSEWQKLTGSGTVVFGDATQLNTTATFSAPGTYTLRLTADDGELTSFSDLIVTVNPVAEYAVVSFSLINADTDLPIPGFESITSDLILNLMTLPTENLSVQANTSGSIGSVRFALDGDSSFQTESVAPYALFGDSNGNFAAGSLSIGSHSLTATPYSGSGATGQAGQALSIEINVIDAQPLAGDFNQDWTVDTADYNIWKDSFGSTTQLAADANGNQVVDATDYAIWRDNLGATLPPPASSFRFVASAETLPLRVEETETPRAFSPTTRSLAPSGNPAPREHRDFDFTRLLPAALPIQDKDAAFELVESWQERDGAIDLQESGSALGIGSTAELELIESPWESLDVL